MIILVTGSRNHDALQVKEHLVAWIDEHKTSETERVIIMHGNAWGADMGARTAVSEHPDWGEFSLPARWVINGRAAGPMRNQEMLDTLRPDVCLALPLPDSRGTWDMVNRCIKAGVPVWVYLDDEWQESVGGPPDV
jgi:hypothetical protein